MSILHRPGIAAVSIVLAAYEAAALTSHKPTISDLSHRYPYSLLVWGWLGWLAVHFIKESQHGH